ncbi:protein kinase, partial [candidate division KSB3 bacterium]|nr:protein kinase [candidate division KSB3 bacterium]
ALGRPGRRAEALEQHARSQEAVACTAEERAAAWRVAAEAFEAVGQMERAVACRREVARWLHQPIIELAVEVGEGLVLKAWSRLRLFVRNDGYGPARSLVIRAHGDEFEGQVMRTQRIFTLPAGQERSQWLDVRPLAHGDSVPLQVSVEYEDRSGESCTCEQTIYIPVARIDADRGAGQVFRITTAGGAVVFGGLDIEGDFVGGDKRTGVDQRGQQVHGPQTTIAGDAHGPVLSGEFQGDVAVGDSGEAAEQMGREADSLRRQLAEARENLSLIRERKAQYVMEVEIPLDLVKQERQIERLIAELEYGLKRSEEVRPALSFDRFSPMEFDRLCLWLVQREGFERAEHLGAAGSEQGHDIVAWREGQRWAFQCKRVKEFGPKDALAGVEKVLILPQNERPAALVFLVTCHVSANTRQQVRERCAEKMECHFWSGTELEERVKRHPDLLREFFGLVPDTTGARPERGSERIGKYEILNEIGRGGFAVVYKARDTSLDRVVALKVQHPYVAQNSVFVQRFEQEAHTVVNLRHPNIVPVYDFGDADGVLYLAMALIGEGHTLRDLLAEQAPLSLADALPILTPLAAALDYLHQHDPPLIHRDVEPANVLLEGEEDSPRVVLTDFGLVCSMEASTGLSEGDTILGTPAYMAPEQADPERWGEVTPLTDVYALGVIAYEILTGHMPFEGEILEVVRAHVYDDPPSPRKFAPDLEEEVSQILLRALAKPPADRYPSASAFVAELQVLVESSVQVERPFAEFVPWFLSLSCSSHVVDVGHTVGAIIKLSRHSHSVEEIIVPDSREPIIVQLDATGLSLLSERLQSFVLPEGQVDELRREIKCVALRPGRFHLAATVHGTKVKAEKSAHVTVSVRRSKSQKPPELPSPIAPRPGRQPDLTTRVYVIPLDEAGLRHRLSYVAFSPLSRLRLPGVPIGSIDVSATQLAQMRAQLAQIVSSMPGATPLSIRTRLSTLGRRLYQTLIPEEADALYREAVASNIASWLVLCEAEPWIPWELVKPFDASGQDDFLGMRFALTRFIEGLGTPRQYEFPLGRVSLTLDERFQENYQPHEWQDLFTPSTVSWSRAPVLQEYAEGYLSAMQYASPVWGLHFESVPDSVTHSSGTIVARDSQQALSERFVQEATLGFWNKRPLVTFGMITLNGRSALTEMERQWVPTFIKAGIASFVGTLWATDPHADRLFWDAFYRAIWARKPLGEAVLAARQHMRKMLPNSMDWLAYFAIGDPMARGYVPGPSEGFASLECLSHDMEQPLRVGGTYNFYASLSLIPPRRYHGRRYRPEPTQIQEPRAMIFAPEFDIRPDKWVPLLQRTEHFGQSFQLQPRLAGQHDLFVSFFDGEEMLQTIDFTVEVRGEQR